MKQKNLVTYLGHIFALIYCCSYSSFFVVVSLDFISVFVDIEDLWSPSEL